MYTAIANREKGESILQTTPFNDDFQAVIINDQISVTFDSESDMFLFIKLTI